MSLNKQNVSILNFLSLVKLIIKKASEIKLNGKILDIFAIDLPNVLINPLTITLIKSNFLFIAVRVMFFGLTNLNVSNLEVQILCYKIKYRG